jgi:hypothetical protein
VGLLAVGIGTFAGTLIGLVCGYWEGRLDLLLQRVMDAAMTIPGLILTLAIVAVLRPSTTNAMLAIAVVIIPGNSRIVRGAVLSAKQNRFVEAAQAIGCRDLRIIKTHILPNVTAPILIIASIWLGNAILIEASLSFLGVGTQSPTPSWRLMLSSTGRAPSWSRRRGLRSSRAWPSAWPSSASTSSAIPSATPGTPSSAVAPELDLAEGRERHALLPARVRAFRWPRQENERHPRPERHPREIPRAKVVAEPRWTRSRQRDQIRAEHLDLD